MNKIYVKKKQFQKNLNAAKPPEQSKGLGGSISCKDKNSTWY